jgi:hypothetical protein
MKIPYKTKAQRMLLKKMKMIPVLWIVINDYHDGLLVMKWLTGEFRYITK